MIPSKRTRTWGSKLRLTTFAAVAVLAIPAVAQTVTISLQGTVTVTTSNKPIAGAIVTAIRNGLPPLSQNATSTASGAFQFSNLPAATYRLCM
jgi:hypothetical protein